MILYWMSLLDVCRCYMDDFILDLYYHVIFIYFILCFIWILLFYVLSLCSCYGCILMLLFN